MIKEQLYSEAVEPEIRDAVVKATSVLGELGASVEEVSLPLTPHANEISAALLAVEPALNYRDWVRERPQDFGHDTRIGLLTGSAMPAQVYYKAQKLRSLVSQQVNEALERYDVLVLPTGAKTAQRIEDFDRVITSKEASARGPYFFTRIFNLASAPAISVPCGFTSQNLPVGL